MNSGGNYYFHHDDLGSTVAITASSGSLEWTYSYTPFGESRQTVKVDPNAPDNPLQYAGELQDAETGLYDLHARAYNPAAARFLSLDPIMQQGGGAAVSAYVYGMNDPLLLIDPSGERPIVDTGDFVLWSNTDSLLVTYAAGSGSATTANVVTISAASDLIETAARSGFNANVVDLKNWSREYAKTLGGRGAHITTATNSGTDPSCNASTGLYHTNPHNALCANLPPPGLTADQVEGWYGRNAYARDEYYVRTGAFTNPFIPTPWELLEEAGTCYRTQHPGSVASQVVFWSAATLGLFGGYAGNAIEALSALRAAGQTAKLEQGAAFTIGHWPEYLDLGFRIDTETFNIAKPLWDAMSEGEQRELNKLFLNRVKAAGKPVRLATPLNNMRPGSAYAWEIDELRKAGYRVSPNGKFMLPPR